MLGAARRIDAIAQAEIVEPIGAAGIFAPRGTPQPVIDRLNQEINKVIEDPDVKARLEAAGAVVMPMSVAQFKDFVQNESAKYLRVIKQTGVTSQ